MSRRFHCLVLFLVALASCTSAAGRPLDADAQLLLPSDAPTAVQLAAADLARDFRKVFGHALRTTTAEPLAPPDGVLLVVHVNAPADLPPETYRIGWRNDDATTGLLDIHGADPRGTVYALYAISQHLLGVDPWWYWTDLEPAPRERIEIPNDFALRRAPPAFRYRGFFINDEDLLVGWRPDPAGTTAISLEVWDRIYETLLRLGGNLVAPGTFPFPDEPQFALAARRGLALNQHHQTPLGFVGFRWPREQVYSPTRDMETLRRVWTHCVDLHPSGEVVWTLGLRGVNTNDAAFWRSDPFAPAEPGARAAIIQRALVAQTEVVTTRRGPDQTFITNLWHEGVEMVDNGELQIPSNVHRVWPDDGYGHLRDGGRIGRGDGVYFHTAYMNGHANQLTEMVDPAVSWDELGRALDVGAAAFLLVNVSDLRPVPLSTDAVMGIAWDGLAWHADAPARARAHLVDWCSRQFEPAAAGELAALYQTYFDQHLRFTGGSVTQLGEHGYFRLHRQLWALAKSPLSGRTAGDYGLRIAPSTMPLGDFVAALQATTAAATVRWQQLENRALLARERVPAARRSFFDDHLLTQIRIHKLGTELLARTCAATLAWHRNERDIAVTEASAALAATEAALAALRATEHGRWEEFYRGDTDGFVDIAGARTRAAHLRQWMATGDASPVTERTGNQIYADLQSYQHGRLVEVPSAP